MSRSRRKPKRLPGTERQDYPEPVLRQALRPFAAVVLPGEAEYKGAPSGDHCWVYIGKWEDGQEPPHLTVADFQRAREVLR